MLAIWYSSAPRPLGYRKMRLTKQTSYALRILIHCALSGGKHVKAADIAAEHGITEFNVAKIVPILVRGGFITTSRGRTGGLKLARAPEEIGIGDVIRVTEATRVEAECVGGTTLPCGIKRAAPINRMLGEAVEAFIEVLDKHKLADLIVARPREAGLLGAGALRRARVASTASH
jgi:Rrf2 family protein